MAGIPGLNRSDTHPSTPGQKQQRHKRAFRDAFDVSQELGFCRSVLWAAENWKNVAAVLLRSLRWRVVAFAGLWDRRKAPDLGEELLDSYDSAERNDGNDHDRMPVIHDPNTSFIVAL